MKNYIDKTKFSDKRGQRKKRDTSPTSTQDQKNLFVDFLVVIDSSVYNSFLQQYGNLPNSLITNYINIYICHLINGVS